jgi:hypothetical protein
MVYSTIESMKEILATTGPRSHPARDGLDEGKQR